MAELPKVNLHYGLNNINAGRLKEFPEICIDRFYGDDLKATAFFLTHAHTDHMVGLEGPEFLKRLEHPDVFLYCEPITVLLLQAFESYLGGKENQIQLFRRGKIKELTVGTLERKIPPHVVQIKTGNGRNNWYPVIVIVLPAEHCPGSVMFLFETGSLRILYTGDYRHSLQSLTKLRGLHEIKDGKRAVKRIDCIYIDTTFCSRDTFFPDRKEIVVDAIDRIGKWIDGSERWRWISIKFAAKFAHEYFLIQLYKRFGEKIHVSPQKFEIYKRLPFIMNIVTLDSQTRFHFCDNRNCRDSEEMLFLKLSCMWYCSLCTDSSPEKKCARSRRFLFKPDTIKLTEKTMNVCYSMHPSLQEVVATIDYLKPGQVTPLVMPFRSTLEGIKDALKHRCKHSFIYQDYYSEAEVINSMKKSKIPKHTFTKKFQSPPVFQPTQKWPEDIDPDDTEESDSEDNNYQEINPLSSPKINKNSTEPSTSNSEQAVLEDQEKARAPVERKPFKFTKLQTVLMSSTSDSSQSSSQESCTNDDCDIKNSALIVEPRCSSSSVIVSNHRTTTHKRKHDDGNNICVSTSKQIPIITVCDSDSGSTTDFEEVE